MKAGTVQATHCATDTVEIARVERFLLEKTSNEFLRLFTPLELEDAGSGPGRTACLAARFAAKEACCKLFPHEISLGLISRADFGICLDAHGDRARNT